MYCNNCGNYIKEDAIFCDKCGAKIIKSIDNNNTISDVNTPDSENNSNISLNNKISLLSIVAAILSIVATFLPFITISFFGTTLQKAYIEGDGKAIVALAILAIIFIIMNKMIVVIVCGAINLLILLYDTYNILEFVGSSDLTNKVVQSMIIKGPGFYLLFIATIGLILVGIYSKKVNNNKLNEMVNVDSIKNKLTVFADTVGDKAKKINLKDSKTKKILVGIISIIVLVIAILFGLSLRNPGRFVKSIYGDKQYKFKNGVYAKSEWVTHNGKEYYFNGNGDMERNKLVDGDYYVDEQGIKRKNSFVDIDENTYYLKNDGKYARNELIDINGKTYAFDADGKNLKDQLWENETPKYTAYVNRSGIIVKDVQGPWLTSDGQEIYIKDATTGDLVISDWIKPEQTKGYAFYDEKGIRQKDKIIAEMNVSGEQTYYVYDEEEAFAYWFVFALLKAGGVNISNNSYYYVNSLGYMATNITKEIDGVEWTFNNEGKGEKKLWEQHQYTNNNKDYIINKKKIKGIYFYNGEDLNDLKDAYLELCFDQSDIAFFVYDDKYKKEKNNYSYIKNNYRLILNSQVNKNYNFTGTMGSKSDRIYVDNHQAITTIKNHLTTGQSFSLALRETGDYSKTYLFWVDVFNFPEVYEDAFGVRNGWKGDSYYINNVKIANQWQEYGGDWYYLGRDGVIAKDQWIDNTYYVDKDGKMLRNTTTPDGFKVDANGKYIKE